MGGDVETIKDRLDIAEVVGSYVKLERAGQSLKARCPFHNEKTPSFLVSPARQSYYCFGCGAKGDIFTFVEEMEGIGFREALKLLAERAGVELKKATPETSAERSETESILEVLEAASQFFENRLKENQEARDYILSRGISEESIQEWHLGYAPAEWRSLYAHLRERGFPEAILIKAGLVKRADGGLDKSPYDVFRDRIIFPLSDPSGRIIAFSGRALAKETEPKYLNSPDTAVFKKQEVLYGLDKAKDKIRRRGYAVLVEGQMDLVLSHQVGIDNTVASSGTAFTEAHLLRLKRLSQNLLLAFDGDEAGLKAAEKSAALAFSLGFEVKIAVMPEGRDPADLVKESPETWKDVLRASKSAIEVFLHEILKEKDRAKVGKLIERKLVPLIALMQSQLDKEHAISLISRYSGKSPQALAEEVAKAKKTGTSRVLLENFSDVAIGEHGQNFLPASDSSLKTRREALEDRLNEVRTWQKELAEDALEVALLKREEAELKNHLTHELIKDELASLSVVLAAAETSNDSDSLQEAILKIKELHREMRALEESRNVL